MSDIFNAIGLILGIIGVFIIFRYGPPQPKLETGVSIVLEDDTDLGDGRTAKDHDEDIKKLREKYSRRSQTGLALIGVGFMFQFIALWV